LIPLTFTLLSDGSSDRALIPILQWLLRQLSSLDFEPQWADLRSLREPPRTLRNRIRAAVTLFPCDLLFVHRDAEGETLEARTREIREHLQTVPDQTAVCVIPVRMMEAWLLLDETVLRTAADNPRGRVGLGIPALDRLEEIPDPKRLLFDLLKTASGLRTGRLHRFHPAERVHRLAELIPDFSPLRRLSAFRTLEADVEAVLTERHWR
jgi:hypothetical protein